MRCEFDDREIGGGLHRCARAGVFRDHWVTLQPSFRWPAIDRMRVARYLIQLDLGNQVVPQQIRVSWTGCNYGGARPWMHCPLCQRRIARLFKGMGGFPTIWTRQK